MKKPLSVVSSLIYLSRTGYLRPACEVVVLGPPFPLSSKVQACLNTVPRIPKYVQFIRVKFYIWIWVCSNKPGLVHCIPSHCPVSKWHCLLISLPIFPISSCFSFWVTLPLIIVFALNSVAFLKFRWIFLIAFTSKHTIWPQWIRISFIS